MLWLVSSIKERDESARGDWNGIYDYCYFLFLNVAGPYVGFGNSTGKSFSGVFSDCYTGITPKYSFLLDLFFM